MTLSVRIVLGLSLGTLVGLFFGESAAVLQPLADIYIHLMQMTVLPYMTVALILGFGSLEPASARRLWTRAGILLLLVWFVAVAVIAAMPLAFPHTTSASFFSTSLVEPRVPFPVADLYFTANPFHALANAVVPAVVLFSSLMGIFLIGLPARERVLEVLRVLSRAIERMTQWVIGLTPFGILAIAAVTAGTMTPETFRSLEVYFLAFVAASLLLAFWILPLMVTAVTPFRYREVVATSRNALVTAFVASNAFMVLPLLVEDAKVLMRKHGLLGEGESTAEILVPILFNFPNAGRLLTLLFVPFAAWMAGSELSPLQLGELFAVGIPTYFAKAQVALPFLLDRFGLPQDLFQLYVPTAIVTGKFDSLVAAMNLFVFGLLGSASMGGYLKLQRSRVLAVAGAGAGGIVVAVLAVAVLAASTTNREYAKDRVLRRMHLSRQTIPAIVHRDRADVQPNGAPATMTEIRARGTLRIGYDPANVPYSFFNEDGQLVGFDVELSRELADALNLAPEFVPVEWTNLAALLGDGTIDAMTNVWYRPYWFGAMRLSRPHLVGTVGLVTRDEDRDRFGSVDALRRSHGLRIGVPLHTTELRRSMERYFDGSDAEFVVFDRIQQYFEGTGPDVDAYLMPAETAAARTLLYPDFTVVVPQPDPVRIPFAFGLAREATELPVLVDEWIVFAENAGTIRQAYEHWILGRGAETGGPRWSIARDVLGWVE